MELIRREVLNKFAITETSPEGGKAIDVFSKTGSPFSPTV
jgi:hypothetical protein